jgi:hypothetical protein
MARPDGPGLGLEVDEEAVVNADAPSWEPRRLKSADGPSWSGSAGSDASPVLERGADAVRVVRPEG